MGTGRRSNLFSRRLGAAFAATLFASAIGAQVWAGSTPTSKSTYYDIHETTGVGDNILRLVNPIGCGNSGVSNPGCHNETDICAMIYVFDDDQEMGECCGCPISPNELKTLSVEQNLTSNWALADADIANGVIVIRSALQNNIDTCNAFTSKPVPGCNSGCDPTFGYTASSTILGSMTRPQEIDSGSAVFGLTETELSDNGGGEAVNNQYLINQCGVLIANGTGNGTCHCDLLPPA